MKRWMWIFFCLIGFGILELPEGSVENLKPVRLLIAEDTGSKIILRTDTGDTGAGLTLEAALCDMEAGAEKRIFLETADQLVLRGNTGYLLPELGKVLRPAVAVCRTEAILDPQEAAEFLSYHKPEKTLAELLERNENIQKLIRKGERMNLENIPRS